MVCGRLVKVDKLERLKEFLKAAQPLWDQQCTLNHQKYNSYGLCIDRVYFGQYRSETMGIIAE